MTFQEMQNDVVDRIGVGTSKDFARAGRALNERYRWLLTALGLEATSRSTITAVASIGSRDVTFTAVKLFSVFNNNVTQPNTLEEVTFDEMRNQATSASDSPSKYSIKSHGATTVVITLDKSAATAYTLSADALVSTTTLTATSTPTFPADFHDLLTKGAIATLLEMQGKYDAATRFESQFESRVADLRFFIAKSAYLELYQGKTKENTPIRA